MAIGNWRLVMVVVVVMVVMVVVMVMVEAVGAWEGVQLTQP